MGKYFVKGALNGAIYDIDTGYVYSVKNPDLQKLGDLKAFESGSGPDIPLRFIWFEIVSDDCNERCVQCYAECMPPTYRKALGLVDEPVSREKTLRQKLTATQWKSLLDEGVQLGCRRCQFIGGEPFLYRGENGETVLDLAEYASSIGYGVVEVFTNATLLTKAKVRRIKDLGVKVAVSLYSIEHCIHDAVTRTPGSCKKTLRALQLLKEYEIPTRVETPLTRINEGTIAETEEWIRTMGFKHRRADPIRPRGRGDNPAIFPSAENSIRYGYSLTPNFKADSATFFRGCRQNACLAGKITITDTGDVIPCIFSRDVIAGNVIDAGSLATVIDGDTLQQVWHTTKDKVLVCQDCEYRYICFDCRPLAQVMTQGRGDYFNSPTPRCTYNPYTGEWAAGVWRLDENGVPYYDRSLEWVFKKVLASQEEKQNPVPEEEEEKVGGDFCG